MSAGVDPQTAGAPASPAAPVAPPPAEPWSITLPGTVPTLTFEPVDPRRHLGLVHRWMHAPHVAPWWDLAGPRHEVAAYLDGQLALPHLQPWVVAADGEPFGYVETYAAHLDPLADAVAAATTADPAAPATAIDDGDRGWHVLVGPPDAIGSGLGRLLGRAVLARAFADPTVRQVVCEPDERNERMVRFCASLGHLDLGHLALGPKRAALLACTRRSFTVRFPDDVPAVRRTGAPS